MGNNEAVAGRMVSPWALVRRSLGSQKCADTFCAKFTEVWVSFLGKSTCTSALYLYGPENRCEGTAT